MKVLITGGAGYIGSHCCIELLNKGYEVVVVDNFCNSKPEVLRRIQEITNRVLTFHEIDILNAKEVEQVFRINKFDAVIHLAGLKAVGESVEMPLRYYHNNITGTLILCEIMKKFSVRRIVFSSSAAVYGMSETVPISENFPLSAANPYGSTKLMIENILKDLYISDQHWSIALLRYFNPIGAHVSGRIGEDPIGMPNNLMPYITQVAVGKRDKLYIYGSDYDTHDGTGVRDYIHVVDLAKGHLKALEKVMSSKGIEAYNLGTGIGYSVFDVVKGFEKATGRIIPYTIVDRRPGDIDKCFANPAKARNELGWIAEKGINDMCIDAWRWQLNNPYGYDKESSNEIASNKAILHEIAAAN